MERKLASIQKIREIKEIPGADAIELAIVNSWQVVVAKNVGHKVGDLVVYCEIDSFLPIEPEFEFLRKSSHKKLADGSEGFRLKTIKLRGQISQGLIIPLKDAISISKRRNLNIENPTEGVDVTKHLGIIKWEPPVPAHLAGLAKGLFPSFISKTDEERIQNLTDKFLEWKSAGQKFIVTEKLDGSSATFYIKGGQFGVCSRNLELKEPESDSTNTFWDVAKKLDIQNKLLSLGKNIAIQGELIGEGIQKNPYKILGHTVKFFNAWDIDGQRRLTPSELAELISQMDLELVPQLGEIELPNTVDELLVMADDKSKLNQNTEREGIVIRSLDGSISFKAISNKFLLKGEN